jgi:tetratricopeptide (TPR) repeat protein
VTRALAVVIALVCALGSVAAGKPSKKALAQADKLLRQGNAEYARKNYEQAIEAYQQAFDLTGAPGFLFNIAQVHRVAGNCSEAIAHYERYLAADPKTVLRPRVETFIAEMWRCVEARRKSEEQEPPAEKQMQTPAEPPPPVIQEERAAPPVLRAEAPPSRPSAWRWVGLGTAGAGAVAIGAGVVIGLGARSEARRTEDFTGEWTPEDEARERDAERGARNGAILMSAGAVALVGGATLYLLTRRPPEATVTAGGRGAALSWRF